MKVVVLDDDTWFDADSADKWENIEHALFEDTMYRLWRTKHGQFVSERWIKEPLRSNLRAALSDNRSPWTLEERVTLRPMQAVTWFSRHGNAIPDELKEHLEGKEI